MSLPEVGDVIELTTIAEFDDTEDVMNVWDLEMTSGTYSTEGDWLSDLENLAELIINLIKISANTLTTWKRLVARFQNKEEPSVQLEITPQVAGTLAGNPVGAGVCSLMVFRTTKPRTVLRKFLGPMAANGIDSEGKLGASFTTDLVAAQVSLMGTLSPGIGEWEYVHWDDTAQESKPVTGGYVSTEPAYQRRRRRGRGS